ncbi:MULTISPECIES: NTP transferase domain-containing protein [Flavobacteriaceae]|uniref:NTP transferase domain-containing protein n=1 Tax=Flavobacteriaceae TaxID=49546 RepID=UPI00149165B0|nr:MULTISPECIES: NTP transferase domain-containing protein [Allomuricauda]MDC6364667.1 NTP transferase domain-containing protein [Muricauda sp. AC10]
MQENNIPKLYGLVLAGGKSTRMGSDKGLLTYHGVPQQEYLYQLLDGLCDVVFLSVREEQKVTIPEHYKTIDDRNEYRGPFNGILSAHAEFPDVAWLVLACDLPLLDQKTLTQMVSERNPTKLATSFATQETKLPEPLVTIWEPEGLKSAIVHLKSTESSCPRKFLINSDIALIFPEQDEVLYNANSVGDYEYAKSKIA